MWKLTVHPKHRFLSDDRGGSYWSLIEEERNTVKRRIRIYLRKLEEKSVLAHLSRVERAPLETLRMALI